MLRWLRRRDRHVYTFVLYGRALRRPKIARNLLRAVARRTVRAVTKHVKRTAKFARSIFARLSSDTPSSGSQVKEKGGKKVESVGQAVREHAAKKKPSKVLEELGRRKEGATLNNDGKSNSPVYAKEPASVATLNSATKSDPVAKPSDTTESSTAPELTRQPNDNADEFDEVTTPVIRDYEAGDMALSKDDISLQKKSDAEALKSLYKSVPFQLQSKLTEAFGVRFKNDRQIRQSQLQQGNSIIPAHRLSFMPYISDWTVGEKESLISLFGRSKFSTEALEEIRKQVDKSRLIKASLEIDILPGVEIENEAEPSIGWADTSMQNFAGKVVVDKSSTATLFAQEEDFLRTDAIDRLVYYLDVTKSAEGSRVGIAIPQRLSSGAATHNQWEFHPVHLRDNLRAREAETAALAFLLLWIQAKLRAELERGSRSQYSSVAIFTPSRDSLSQLAQQSPVDPRGCCQYLLLKKIVEVVNDLASNGVQTELHWVPREASVRGNQVAQVVAGKLTDAEYTISLLNAAAVRKNGATPKPEPSWPPELVRAQKQGKSLLEQMKDMDDEQKIDLLERLREALKIAPMRLRGEVLQRLANPTKLESVDLGSDIYDAPVPHDPLRAHEGSVGANSDEENMSDHVFILPRAEAMAFAFEDEHVRGTDTSRDVYWTDASAMDDYSSMACVTRKRHINRQLASSFRRYSWYLTKKNSDTNIAELAAIVLTLKEAWKGRVAVIEGRQPEQVKTIVIFTDNADNLRQLTNQQPVPDDSQDGRWLLEKVREWIRRYKRVGVNVQLHWVPAHSRIPGNEYANELAQISNRYARSRRFFDPQSSRTTEDLAIVHPDSPCESTPNELIQLAPTDGEMERILSQVFESLHSRQQKRLADLFGFGFDPDWAQDGSRNARNESLLRCIRRLNVRDQVILARGLLRHVETSSDVLKKVRHDWVSRDRRIGFGRHASKILEDTNSHPQAEQKVSCADLNLRNNITIHPWPEAIADALDYDVLTTESRSQHSCYIDMRIDERRSPPKPRFAIASNILTSGKREFSHTYLISFKVKVDLVEAQLIGIISLLAELLKVVQSNQLGGKQVVRIFSDFRAALKLLRGDSPQPSPRLYPLAKEVANLVGELHSHGFSIQMNWMPGNTNARGYTVTNFLFKQVLGLDSDADKQASTPEESRRRSKLSILSRQEIASMREETKKSRLELFQEQDALDTATLMEIRDNSHEGRVFNLRFEELASRAEFVNDHDDDIRSGKGETFVKLVVGKQLFIEPEIDSALFSFSQSYSGIGAYWIATASHPTNGGYGAAIARKIGQITSTPSHWLTFQCFVHEAPSRLVAELCALVNFLTFIQKQQRRARASVFGKTVLFCENKEILQYLAGHRALPSCTTASTLLVRASQWIDLYASVGHRVELHWVPPGMPVAGSVVANAVAEDVRRSPQAQRKPTSGNGGSAKTSRSQREEAQEEMLSDDGETAEPSQPRRKRKKRLTPRQRKARRQKAAESLNDQATTSSGAAKAVFGGDDPASPRWGETFSRR